MPNAKVIVISGTSSTVGKTSVTVGMMMAFRRRGLKVQAYKVGPDFLDPLYHVEATGRPSINLDGWMMTKQQNLDTFWRNAADADICIVEGCMGLFDGSDGKSESGSTAEMAKWLGAPVLLVMDCCSMARSAAAMVKGFQEFDPELNVAGVVFNKVAGAAHKEWLSEAVASTGVHTIVFGGMPKVDAIEVKERYLGLHMPHEREELQTLLINLSDWVEANLDMLAVIQTAATAQPQPQLSSPQKRKGMHHGRPPVQIGVAKDAAFAFYYNDNLRLLEEAGADLVFFSAIEDDLPTGLAGVYLGGGYPENYAQQLSDNKPLIASLRAFANAGGLVYAECGGLIYLSQSIQPQHELPVSMVGLFPFRTHMSSRMKMGYIEVETGQDCNIFPPNTLIRGQVYHYSEILRETVVGGWDPESSENVVPTCYQATMKVPGAKPIAEGFMWKNVLASYIHLNFGSNPELAQSLVDCCNAVDIDSVSAAAIRAAIDTEAAMAHAEQQTVTHHSHQYSMMNGAMHKIMSVPDLAMPLQTSLHRSSTLGRLSGDSFAEDIDRGYAHTHPQHAQHQQHAQRRSARERLAMSPQRTSSLPIFQKPIKPYSMPASPLHEVAEHSAVYPPAHSHGSRMATQHSMGQAGVSPPGMPGISQPDYMQAHQQRQQQLQQQLDQQVHQQLYQQQQSPFQSPLQAISPHGTQTPPYPTPPQDQTNMYGMQPGPDSLQTSPSMLSVDYNGMLTANTGMLSSQSSMLPDGVMYHRSNSNLPANMSAAPAMHHHASVSSLRPATSSAHLDGVGFRADETATASTSGYISQGMPAGAAYHPLPSTQPHSPSVDSSNSIVSLLSSGTEILYALGLEDRLIGVSSLCDYPEDAASKPKISNSLIDSSNMSSAEVNAAMQDFKAKGQTPFTIDAAFLAMHRPSLVLTQDSCRACDVDSSTTAKALQSAALETQGLVLKPKSLAGVMQSILQVGRAAGAEAAALHLVNTLQKRLRQVACQVSRARFRPKVLMLAGLEPLCLGGHWIPDLIHLAGARDIAQQPGDPAKHIDWDTIRKYAPDVLLISPCSSNLERSLGEMCLLAKLPGWWALPAVKSGQVYICDHVYFSRPGPRLVDGVELLGRIMHPGLLSRPAPANTIRKLSMRRGTSCRPNVLHQHFKPYT